MGFEDRFPRAGKIVRVTAATLVPGLMALFFVTYLASETPHAARPGELERLAADRALYVAFFALFPLAFGAFCGEVAFPHSAAVPALLGALAIALIGVAAARWDFARSGPLELHAFLMTFVAPPAYLLGALWRQRRRRRLERRSG